jgi:hypothetical protein
MLTVTTYDPITDALDALADFGAEARPGIGGAQYIALPADGTIAIPDEHGWTVEPWGGPAERCAGEDLVETVARLARS